MIGRGGRPCASNPFATTTFGYRDCRAVPRRQASLFQLARLQRQIRKRSSRVGADKRAFSSLNRAVESHEVPAILSLSESASLGEDMRVPSEEIGEEGENETPSKSVYANSGLTLYNCRGEKVVGADGGPPCLKEPRRTRRSLQRDLLGRVVEDNGVFGEALPERADMWTGERATDTLLKMLRTARTPLSPLRYMRESDTRRVSPSPSWSSTEIESSDCDSSFLSDYSSLVPSLSKGSLLGIPPTVENSEPNFDTPTERVIEEILEASRASQTKESQKGSAAFSLSQYGGDNVVGVDCEGDEVAIVSLCGRVLMSSRSRDFQGLAREARRMLMEDCKKEVDHSFEEVGSAARPIVVGFDLVQDLKALGLETAVGSHRRVDVRERLQKFCAEEADDLDCQFSVGASALKNDEKSRNKESNKKRCASISLERATAALLGVRIQQRCFHSALEDAAATLCLLRALEPRRGLS